MTEQDLALTLMLIPIVGLAIAYAIHVFRHGNVTEEDNSVKTSEREMAALKEELAALRTEVGALRNTISSLDCGTPDENRD